MAGIELKSKVAKDRVALRGVRVHTVLAGMCQKTVVEQLFVNREPHAIEAVYTFPLPEGAAVCGFEIVTGDRVLTGAVEETEQAIDQYETAISAGDGAYLVEQERPDVFTLRVGNIKPRQATIVRLTYIGALDLYDSQIRVAFPTTIAPRYIASAGMDPLDAAIDGDALNPPHMLAVPYGLTFTAEVRLGRKVKRLESPSHAVQVSGDDAEGYRLSIPGPVAMDRDVVLTIELAREIGPHAQVESGKDNQSFLAVTLAPEFEVQNEHPTPSETVFLLDCSGSMAGRSIEQATAALELCLRSLNDGDAFNICKFGSSFELMRPEPLVYSQQTLDKAIDYIAGARDLGGTELFQPLELILRSKPTVGTVRNVILLTDGQVSNEPAILKMARRHRSRNRIFSFGIGPASSAFLVKGLARATGGACEFIAQEESFHEKVLRTFARIASPMATDVRIDWGGADAQTLAELPPIFDGDLLTVYARVLGRLPTEVSLTCRTESGEQRWPVAVPADRVTDGGIGAMWARRTIQSLEETNGITRTVAQCTPSREREMVISLSKEFGLLSSLTTFVAVEHRSIEERNDGAPTTRRVPVMLASGWGETLGAALPVAPGGGARSRMSYADVKSRSRPGGIQSALDASFAAPGRTFHRHAPVPSPDKYGTLQESASGAAACAPALAQLLKGQTAAGDFGRSALDRVAAMFPDYQDVVSRAKAFVPDGAAEREKLVPTVHALLLLMSKFASDKPVWKRAAVKGIRFVAKALGRPVAEVEAELKRLV